MTNQPAPGSDGQRVQGCTVELSQTGSVCVVSVSGTLDMLTAPQLEASLTAARDKAVPAIIVDLSAVDFLASAGMGALVAAHAELTPATRLVMVADGPTTSRPLKLVGIADLIELFTTLDDALAAVGT